MTNDKNRWEKIKKRIFCVSTEMVAYCATCNEVFGVAEEKHWGIRLKCRCQKETDEEHIAEVVRGDVGKFWLRWARRIERYRCKYTPRRWGDSWKGITKGRVWPYLVLWFVVLLISLEFVSWLSLWKATSILLAALFLFDTLLVNTAIAFVARSPTEPLRTVILTLFGFSQVVVAFAVFYRSMSERFEPGLDFFLSLYFSFVTITTLGYGDVRPKPQAWDAQLLVIFELIVGLYFLTVIVAIVTGWASSKPVWSERKNVDEVLKR